MSKLIERDKMERLMLVMQQAMVKTGAGDLESAMLCMKEDLRSIAACRSRTVSCSTNCSASSSRKVSREAGLPRRTSLQALKAMAWCGARRRSSNS